MSNYPIHNQEYFYKFVSMETARLILESGKFRYTSPTQFNDPFDLQTELYFDFDISDLAHLVTEKMDALVRGRRFDRLDDTSGWYKAIAKLQEQHQRGCYKREHLNISAEPLLKLLSGILDDTRNKYNEAWKVQLKAIRVFCISEHNQSLLMWSHYAKYHTGVCFKLEVMADKESPLCPQATFLF